MTISIEYLTNRAFNVFSLLLIALLLLVMSTFCIVAFCICMSSLLCLSSTLIPLLEAPPTIDVVAALLFLRWIRDNDTIVLSREVLVELSSLATAAIVVIVVIVTCFD